MFKTGKNHKPENSGSSMNFKKEEQKDNHIKTQHNQTT